MKKLQKLKNRNKVGSVKDLFDFSNLSTEQKILYGKCISAVVILAIIMCYAVSFAIDSRSYNTMVNNDAILDSNVVYNGVYIAETPIGGLTKEQAVDVASNGYGKTRLDGYTITLVTDYGYENTMTYKDLGAEYDIESIVDDAYEYNRSGSRSERLAAIDSLTGKTEHLTPQYTINEDVLSDVVDKIAKDVNKEYSIKGKSVDVDRLYQVLYEKMQVQENDIIVYVPETK